jgi:fumarate reductase iron-sulfur subunit
MPPMPDSTEADKFIELRVLRYRPGVDNEPVFALYSIPYSADMSVLQALQTVKDQLDGTLTFRWSCRMAICGSCGMMINGEAKLACSSFLRDLTGQPVVIEPLRNFPIERDLVVTVEDFVKKIESIYPYIMPKTPRGIEEGEYLQTPGQLAAYESFSDCINCMLCYAACPQFGVNPAFIGPGAMALLQRYNADSRDGGQQQRLDLIHGEDGVWSCTAVGLCSEVCPKQVDPAHAVNQNKSKSALDFFLRLVRSEAS